MLHIRKVIQKISEENSKEFIFWLEQNDAAKCAQLFSMLRDTQKAEPAIATELQVTPSAFYTLKSRLNCKIQDFFAHNIPDSDIDLLKNVANIPNLLFNTPKEIAITHLLKMEKELIEHDMPYALTTVYSALKKLNRYSQKYFDYAQLYNKHLAYTMTIDKAKEMLADFNKLLGEFLMSRDEKILELLQMIQKEMQNYATLYDSHHLIVYRNILNVEYALFAPNDPKDTLQASVDELLTATDNILCAYKRDMSYQYLKTVIDFLWFRHCLSHGLDKKSEEYFDRVNAKLSEFLLNNFCCFPTAFLLQKAEIYASNNEGKKLYEECKALYSSFTPEKEDAANYINHIKFQAIAAFYVKKYSVSASLLNELLNTISFRNFTHAEIEVKLFLALCYLLANKTELADSMIKNVQRKIREAEGDHYVHATAFAKMLALQLDPPGKRREEKIIKMKDEFLKLNRGDSSLLGFIQLNNTFLKTLSKREEYIL